MSARAAAARVVVVAPDCGDARLAKRLVALRDAGAQLVVLSFDRGRCPAAALPVPFLNLGATRSEDYRQRLAALARAVPQLWRCRERLRGARRVYAINVDCAALGLVVRLLARSSPELVVELADVQPVMTRRGPRSTALRLAERFVLRRTTLVVTTSPAYVREYLAAQGWRGPHLLLENRVHPPLPQEVRSRLAATSPGEPWRIGWFGDLRCRRSWEIMQQVATSFEGRVQFLLAGRPTMPGGDRFEAEVAATRHVDYVGPYSYPDGLPALYSSVHLNWCIDLTAEEGNSAWFLPNRLYEGGLFGVPALARDATETGRWTRQRGTGLLLGHDLLGDLTRTLDTLTTSAWLTLRGRVTSLPVETWQGTDQYDAFGRLLCAP